MSKIKRKSVTVTVARTHQLVQFHPVTVTVSETAEVGDADLAEVKLELYKSATASVTKYINNEIKLHGKD